MLRALVLSMMGLLVAAIGVAVVMAMQSPATPMAAAERAATILVAAGPVRAGSLLQPSDLTTREVPESTLPDGASRDTSDARRALSGAMVRRSLDTGSPIIAGDVLRPGDHGFLAAVLQPGTRAVSVAVDAVSGTAGLIWPGDRVDVLLTQTLDGLEQGQAHRVSGEVVLADVRVIAVDQQLVQGGQAPGMLDGKTPTARTITLEVSPTNAARIAVAERLGKLQAVLRGVDPVTEPTPGLAAGATLTAAAVVPERVTMGISAAVAAELPASVRHTAGMAAAAAPLVAAAARAAASQPVPAAPSQPVWGGDVSAALRHDSTGSAAVAVRVFEGSKQAEEYKF